jgi:hypothetical protein
VSRSGPVALVCAVVTALLGGTLAAPDHAAAGPSPGADRAARPSAAGSMAVPALMSAGRLRAQLPGAGTVAYRLPALPVDGVRVLGDWNGDGVSTPGVFSDGQWQLWNQVERPGRAPEVTTTFGEPGDLPVTGDWNGDGVTDLGVVRGSEWLLARGPYAPGAATPSVWRDLTFGDGTGVPVVGDWNGDGHDSVGVFAGGRWSTAPSLRRVASPHTVWYGRSGDAPVVGDWNGDGTADLGVVRGDTWYLDGVGAHGATVHRTFPALAGETPAAWPVTEQPGAVTCPTARPGSSGPARRVVPSTLLDVDVPHPGRVGSRVRASLEDSERYLLGDRYDELWRHTRTRPYLDLLDRGTSDELSIRLPAMSALTVAVGLRTGAYDPASVERSRAAGYHYVDQLVRSIACAHVSVSPGGWGRGWETAHWAMLTGAAGWLVWDRLSAATQADVASMVVNEADRLSKQAVPYWAQADGSLNSPGDTKAEENAWNSSLLALAAAMMPAAPQAARWRAQAAELAVAAYSTQSDDTSESIVNGVPLSARLQGYNAYPDGTVENHHIIHPDYAAAIELLWGSADFDRLARRRVPEAMFHHGRLVYSALSNVSYVAGDASPSGGTYLDPGGTVYEPGHSGIYYPQGDDWGTARRAHFVSLDAHAEVYGRYLHVDGWPAARALAWHETGQRDLVATSGTTDGRTYSVDPEVAAGQDTYPGREEYAAQNLASAWLALYVGELGVPRLDRSSLPVPRATARAPKAPATGLLGP